MLVRRIRTLIASLLALLYAGGSSTIEASNLGGEPGADIIGQQAPEFEGLTWINSKPLTLHELKGRPVFIRFWLINCPLCSGSAQALNYLQETYGPRGLVVIGTHHPKSEAAKSIDAIREGAGKLGFTFPIAQDADWKTINKMWLTKKRPYTSASLLIDKEGKVAWVHEGGILSQTGPGSDAFAKLESKLAAECR